MTMTMFRRPDLSLVVALGEQHFIIERPWGKLPDVPGRVTDVACSSDDHVFVLLRQDRYVDPSGPSVCHLSPEGELLDVWGDEVADAHCLTILPDGRIVVVDRDAHEIIIFNRSGVQLSALGQRHRPNRPFCHPTDIAVAPAGDLYVADGYGASRIHRFDSNGNSIGNWGGPGCGPGQFRNPHALWVLPDGRVAVADRENNRVQLFTGGGEAIGLWDDFYMPTALFGDAEGNLYVTDAVPRLTQLSPEGVLRGCCRPMVNGAHGLSGDSQGRLYLAESNPSRISRLVPIDLSSGSAR